MFSPIYLDFGSEYHTKLCTIVSTSRDSLIQKRFIDPDSRDSPQLGDILLLPYSKDTTELPCDGNGKASTSDTALRHKHYITIALNDVPFDTIKTTCTLPCRTMDANSKDSQAPHAPSPQKLPPQTVSQLISLMVLSSAVMIIFSSYRAVIVALPNITSPNDFGALSLMVVYLISGICSFGSPFKLPHLSSKSCILISLVFYILWIGLNFQPSLELLLPTAVLHGLAQAVFWNGQYIYVSWEIPTSGYLKRIVQRWNVAALGLAQSAHLWGNLASSLVLVYTTEGESKVAACSESLEGSDNSTRDQWPECYNKCGSKYISDGIKSGAQEFSLVYSTFVLILLGASFLGFVLLVFALDRTRSGSRAETGHNPLKVVRDNFTGIVWPRSLCFLLPLVMYSGFGEGFILVDYNRAFISCSLGPKYVGLVMMTLTLSQVVVYFLLRTVTRGPILINILTGCLVVFCPALTLLLHLWQPLGNTAALVVMFPLLWGAFWSGLEFLINVTLISRYEDIFNLRFPAFRALRLIGVAFSIGISLGYSSGSKLIHLVVIHGFVFILFLLHQLCVFGKLNYKPKLDRHLCCAGRDFEREGAIDAL